MLRYFDYLLPLLLLINWSFCYDYISKEGIYKPRKIGKYSKHRLRSQRIRENGGYVGGKHHDFEEFDKGNPVAEIDVASFIQKPDYDGLDENSPYEIHLANGKWNNFGDNMALSESNLENDNQEQAEENSNLQVDNSAEFDKSPEVTRKDTVLVEQGVHKPQKKCLLKNLKFPFFSHNKTGPPKPKKKKKKKRKLFRRNKNTKVTTSGLLKSSELNVNSNKNPDELNKMKKRSYEERLCPLCKRKFAVNVNKDLNERVSDDKFVHNSRQYYQELSDALRELANKDLLGDGIEESDAAIDRTERVDGNSDKVLKADVRRKRENPDFDRERQLKELEEVQKKVDSLEISGPGIPKGRFEN